MATQVVFGRAGDQSQGNMVPVLYAEGMVSETIAESGSNQTTTAVAPSLGFNPVCVIVSSSAIYAAVGAAPDALTQTTSRMYIPAGVPWAFGCKAGDKAAVVAA